MNARIIHEEDGQKSFALAFETGDEIVSGLTDFAKENGIDAASFTALGAFSSATLGYFDIERKEYREIPVEEQVEVLSLIGNVALFEDEPRLHPHVVLGKSDGAAVGGHLLEAHVRPILEVILTESPSHLQRSTDEETGLPLLSVRN